MNEFIELLLSYRSMIEKHSLFGVGILLLIGYLLSRIVKKAKLPQITGFIISGLILGDSLLGIIHHDLSESLTIITDVALGLIALTMGSEFYFTKLKKIGNELVIMTLCQISISFTTVFISMTILKFKLPYALLLGAIATATAPAAIVSIVQSLRAHGKFIDRLYGLVALADAGCIIVFSLVFSSMSSLLGLETDNNHIMILEVFSEIILSIFIGSVIGFLNHTTTKKITDSGELLIITLGFVFLNTSLMNVFHLSSLLSNMAAGALLINLSSRNHRIFNALKPLTPPIYALFFAIAGTELNPMIFLQGSILIVGLVFVISRALGKYFGIKLGGFLSKTDKLSSNYLGLCMFPQAGVSIGLVLLLKTSPLILSLPDSQLQIINLMVNIILLSVFINEIVGPIFSKNAIIKALDIKE